jgi:predicted metalloprotease with PDZ domain
MSDLLWYAEGFTNYYGKLALKRSGYFSQEAYFEQVLKALNRTLQAPGRRFHGPAGMSQQAVFVDAGVSVDPTDYGNNYLSYYTYGEVVALGLDLQLRVQFGKNLDQLMRQMWVLHGKTEIPYDAAALQKQLAAVSGDVKFAEKFFNEQINQSQLPDFKALFAELGLILQLAEPDKAFAGLISFRSEGAALLVASRPYVDSPWANAGVALGDTLLQLGDYPISTEQDVQLALKHAKPGEKLALKYQQKGELITTEILLGQDPRLTLSVDDKATEVQIKRRNDWLDSQAVNLTLM